MKRRLVFLAALGYFVDILDLFLFNVLRIPSLKDLGVQGDGLLTAGTFILNCQMTGLLIGCFVWGMLGDKRGRLSVLYGSILLYSLATLANATVQSVAVYGVWRFLAGLGLAGELGAAITLVSETLSKERRGIGTTLVAGVGLLGGTAAALMAEFLSWRHCYVIGGCAGLLLLLLRFRLTESSLYAKLSPGISRGSIKLLFTNRKRRRVYLWLIIAGIPIYYVAGILMVFSPELAKAIGVLDPITASQSILYSYIGVALGDFASGFLCQWIGSRKRVVKLFLVMVCLGILAYFNTAESSALSFYTICFMVGVATGYWAVLITMVAEHFGTNLRATVTTTVPNLIRASVIPMLFLLDVLRKHFPLVEAAGIIGAIVLGLAFLAVSLLEETYYRELSFVEK